MVITNGEQGAKPAEVGQTVMALTQETEADEDVTLHNILYYNEFVVGDENGPEPAFYQITAGEEPILTKLDKNYVDDESIDLNNGDALIGEDNFIDIYVEDIDIPDASRVYSNVSTVTARTSEGNEGRGYELSVIIDADVDVEESINIHYVSVYYDGEALPNDFFYSSGSRPYTNVTLSLPNGATYTTKLLQYMPE